MTFNGSFKLALDFGLSLSLGALETALGMMVDNSIVVDDSFVMLREKGKNKIDAANRLAMPKGQPVLEMNPDHQKIARMKELFAADKDSAQFKEYAGLLYDQALLLEGDKPRNPVAFSKALSKLMAEGVSAG